jgi:outer membrane protein assembly factor BamB
VTVIDLGELRGDAEPARRPPPRAVGRPLRVALAGVVALLTLVASVPVVRPASAVLAGRTGAQVMALNGRIYVVEPVTPGDGGRREVAVYATPAGGGDDLRPLWRTSTEGSVGPVGVREHAGLALFTGNFIGSRDGRGVETLALDLAGGERRWRQPGHAIPSVGGGLLLLDEDDGGAGTLRAVDPATGEPRWSVPGNLSDTVVHSPSDEAELVVRVSGDGRTEVRDAGSGTLRASLDLPRTRPGQLPSVSVVGDLLLVVPADGGVVTAYGVDALERRWELAGRRFGHVQGCGRLLCVFAPETGGLFGVDPATGRIRWAGPEARTVLAVRGDRLLVTAGGRPGTPPPGTLVVLDAATGRERADLGSWELADVWSRESRLIGTRRSRDGALVVAELDVVGAAVRVRDVLPDAVGECAADGRDLVCRHYSGGIGWWRLPG